MNSFVHTMGTVHYLFYHREFQLKFYQNISKLVKTASPLNLRNIHAIAICRNLPQHFLERKNTDVKQEWGFKPKPSLSLWKSKRA